MVSHVQKEGLTWWSVEEVEVLFKICWKLHAGVVGEVVVQGLDQTLKSAIFLQLFNGPVLE